jgi:putative ABC transport system permease protein
MRLPERLRFVIGALEGHRLRSVLSALGIAIGIAAVLLLTSLGEGTRRYIVTEFSQFGTNLLAIVPGNVKTIGIPGVFGGSTHPLDLEDAAAIRRLDGVGALTPVVMGQARVEHRRMGRSVYIYGVSHEVPDAWSFRVSEGAFLPAMDYSRKSQVVVLGPKVAHELLGEDSPLGERVKIGGETFRVIGIMAPKGQLLGFDIDDAVYIPAGTAMALFNLRECHEIDVSVRTAADVDRLVRDVHDLIKKRHRGQEDFTIQTQADMLGALNRIMGIITLSVGAIAGISLLVGAIGILTIMWVSVHERTYEIGLLRALGVTRSGVAGLFLLEATTLSLAGGLGGLAAGYLVKGAMKLAVPGLPMEIPWYAVVSAVGMSFAVGMASGYLPARRAASLDPVEALRAE